MATTASSSRLSRLSGPLGLAGLVAAAGLALHFRDPHRAGSWGICPTKWLFNLDCPACGSLRAVHDLTDLDLVSAASSNLLLVLALPVVAVVWVDRVAAAWSGVPRPAPLWGKTLDRALRYRPMWWLLMALVAGFTVLRNLPAGAWLHS
ncbi:MAG: DUF2752 domain-containing protein [Nocardioides sp.]